MQIQIFVFVLHLYPPTTWMLLNTATCCPSDGITHKSFLELESGIGKNISLNCWVKTDQL